MRKEERIRHFKELTGSKARKLSTLHQAVIQYLAEHPAQPIYKRGNRDVTLHPRWKECTLERKADRAAAHFGVWRRDVADQYAQELTLQYVDIERAGRCYRQSRSRWAGGGRFVQMYVREIPDCCGRSRRAWSYNGKWSGTDSFLDFCVTARAVQIFPSLIVGGLVTLDATPVEGHPRAYGAVWAEQGKGFNIKPVQGFIIKGYHAKTNNFKAALKKVAEARRAALQTIMRRRADRANHSSIWVSYEDSIRGGNCPSGTKAFAHTVARAIGAAGDFAVRADVLLRIRNDGYTRRAVRAAEMRYRT
jgi:hypothetical protein